MVRKLSIQDLPLQGKKALIRVDFNVPLDSSGAITDDTRIRATLPSIRYVLDHGGSVILMSHLGRPKGKPQKEFSLAPCSQRLSQLLGCPVTLAPDCIGSQTEQLAKNLKPGQVLLLENLRFHKAEEDPKSDPTFAEKLAKLGDVYINEAFGSAHRAHSSTATLTRYFPGRAAAGFNLMKEIQFIGGNLLNPKRPFYAIVGGNKVSTKLGVLKSLLKKADGLFLGGAMAFTFLKAQGFSIGSSLCEDELIPQANEILSEAKRLGIPLWLPTDVVVVPKIDETLPADHIATLRKGIPEGLMGVDIGPETIATYQKELQKAHSVLWNGPMGVFEISQFAKGTEAIAKLLAGLSATTIIGGGDSLAAVQHLGLGSKMSHLSTGGGATLEYIEFGTLPGIEALSDAPEPAVKGRSE